jgi:hypothetical protein
MKITLLTLLGIVSFASHQLGAYTWTVQNLTGKKADIEVCTTPGIDSCKEIKNIQNNGKGTFAFKRWYNKGLCLGRVKVKGQAVGIPTPTWLKDKVSENTINAVVGTLGLILVALTVHDYCSDKHLAVKNYENKPKVYIIRPRTRSRM